MPLHLRIENETSLPDGGPIAITVTSKRAIDIGRDSYLDWVLPDPTRVVSGTHCKVEHRDGQYWLTDVSTNGTFLNRSEFRLASPHALRDGDRIEIGRYIVSVRIEPDAAESHPTGHPVSAPAAAGSPIWDVADGAAPAINPRELRSPSIAAGFGSRDALDWASDLGLPMRSPSHFAGPDWGAPPAPLPPAPPSPVAAPPLPAEPTRPQAVRPDAAPGGAAPGLPSTPADAWLTPADALSIAAADAVRNAPPVEAPAAARQAEPSLLATPLPAEAEVIAERAAAGTVAQVVPGATAVPAALVNAPRRAAPGQTDAPLPPAVGITVPVQVSPTGGQRPDAAHVIERFAKGAGLSASHIAEQDAGALAEQIGQLVRLTIDSLHQLQHARVKSKGAMRSASQTMVQSLDNNPIRFAPTTDDALRILFGQTTKSYLDPFRSIDGSFADLKKHQIATFAAMQTALSKLLDDLDPKTIDGAIPKERGVTSLIGSRKAKLWERYETVWSSKAGMSEHGMLDIYMRLFADAYDKNINK